jgi:glyoxylase-like metal-dependent hydrolase (beta-lactamase superfamily II)
MRYMLFVLMTAISAQGIAQEKFKVTTVDTGLHHLYYDSSTAKTTIVEFDKFLALLEVPIRNEGGGARVLTDQVYAGRQLLMTLEKQFPKKPVKYVLHTHWHPHSLSAVRPFLEKGITIVTTANSLEKIKTFVSLTPADEKLFKVIASDSLVIKDKGNKIVVHRFEQKQFTYAPTAEYLYFYLPKYKALHTGCMYNKWQGDPIEGRELLTGREEDIQKFLTARNLKPGCFIRGSGDSQEPKAMIAYEKFADVIQNGVRSADIAKRYVNLPDNVLESRQDSIVNVAKTNNIPPSFFNSAVYNALRSKQLARALNLAKINLALNPDDPNGWDTLGEVYYFLDQREIARVFETTCKKIDATFVNGGEQIWKADLEEYKKSWPQ